MAINISDERVKQVTKIVKEFSDGFVQYDPSHISTALLAHLDEKIEWFDHGFHAVRRGHEAILGLQKGFLHCNQPFNVEIKSLHVTVDGAAVEQIWTGKCANDIIRPDGQVIIKANGKEFKQYVGFFFKISEAGKIYRIDEYDHRYWAEGKSEEDYASIGSVSSVS